MWVFLQLVTISEYLVRQMKENMPSLDNADSDDEDDFQSDEAHFTSSIGMIYDSKVQMLCQAYTMYSDGLSRSLQLLSELRKSKDFSKFIKVNFITKHTRYFAGGNLGLSHLLIIFCVVQFIIKFIIHKSC